MSRRDPAAIFARPRRWVLAAAGLMAMAPLAGCSHHRSTSYRPVYATPTSGCSSCGSSGVSTTVTPESGAASMPSSSSVSTPSIDSSVTPSSTYKGSSGTVRSSTVERPPSAQIGPDPDLDVYSSSGRNSAKPVTPPTPASPAPARRWSSPRAIPGPRRRTSRRTQAVPGSPAGPPPPPARNRAAVSPPGSSRTSPARAPASSSIPTRPSALALHRPAPQRLRRGQLRRDRPRAPQAARLRRLRLPLHHRQRQRQRRRPDRGRPAVGQPEARRPLPQRPHPRRRRIRHRHLPDRRPRPAAAHPPPDRRHPGPRRLPEPPVPDRRFARLDPRPSRRHAHRLPRQVLPRHHPRRRPPRRRRRELNDRPQSRRQLPSCPTSRWLPAPLASPHLAASFPDTPSRGKLTIELLPARDSPRRDPARGIRPSEAKASGMHRDRAPMNDIIRLLSDIEHGDPSAADRPFLR